MRDRRGFLFGFMGSSLSLGFQFLFAPFHIISISAFQLPALMSSGSALDTEATVLHRLFTSRTCVRSNHYISYAWFIVVLPLLYTLDRYSGPKSVPQ